MPNPKEIAELVTSMTEAGLVNIDASISHLSKQGSNGVLENLGNDSPEEELLGWYVGGGSGYVVICK
ncbi:hypothetical protein OG889_20125 [Streptomyces sp. NBC_00481]|uniref:hypothetical protein n=1 Tax=unclassified Streptomyces TaxID=2593676 RepID=UPI002DDC335C|nr:MULTISPECIES: hypothetical protein [unclassified Streptomyces]WRY96853.1 hypothetical protein OG889_20125 [Streptomyces sp. NBC_00481]